MALTLTLLALAFLMSVMVVPYFKRRDEQRLLVAGKIDYEPPPPVTTVTHLPPSYQRTAEAVILPALEPAPPNVLGTTFLHLIPPRTRRHTGIAGATGDGKTATFNTMLVADIASGAHCVVCNTHFTAYHPEDQPIDLRPILHMFEVAYEVEHIRATIVRVVAEATRRLELYRAGQDVGQDIVLYVGEWGSVKRNLGIAVVDQLMKLLDEGRKTRIWMVVEYHSLLVSRTGGDSALREMYTTLLAGNVDPTTWKFVVGEKIEQHPVPLGTWMTERGSVRVVRPGAEIIGHLARRAPAMTTSFTAEVSSDSMPDDDAVWADVRRLVASIDAVAGTSSPAIQESRAEGEPTTAEPVRASSENAVLADTGAIKPVRTDLPQDELSKAIRALVLVPFSRNKIIDLLHMGTRGEALKRIKQALGETLEDQST